MEEKTSAVSTVVTAGELVTDSGLDGLLSKIRAEWQAKSLIMRVNRLLLVDPSSACQRILNAALHDLREKIVIAGIDIAKEAASEHRLPAVTKADDVLENYSSSNVLDLAYRIGILSRPDWRRMRRCYDIRRDLEHEDDEYEAEIEDVVYMFKSCVEIVLAQDPIQLLQVSDVEDVIQASTPVIPTVDFFSDYEKAPYPRQKKIMELLVHTALNSKKPDITRQNSVEMLRSLQARTHNTVKIELGRIIQKRIGRDPIDLATAKVASASGVMPYLKQRQVKQFFLDFYKNRFEERGYHWKQHSLHSEIFNDFDDVGGLKACPTEPRREILLWLTLCYLGERGGYGAGIGRPVFYSNSGASRVAQLFKETGSLILNDFKKLRKNKQVKRVCRNKHIARRYEKLLDILEAKAEEKRRRFENEISVNS